MSHPYFPLYVADYLSATGHLNAAESGAYLHLLMHAWQKGKLPTDDRLLARIARMTAKQWALAKPILQEFFSADWVNERLESERVKADLKSKARADAGSRGGTAKALKSNGEALAKATDLLEQNGSKDPSKSLPSSQGLGLGSTNVLPFSDADASLVNGTRPVDASPVAENVISVERKIQTAAKAEAVRTAGEWWNGLAASLGLPQIDAIKPGSARETHTWARCREFASEFGSLPSGLSALGVKIRGSPFLTGRSRTFRITFDWTMNAANCQKILEGNYEDTQERRVLRR